MLHESDATYIRNEKPLGACSARNRAIEIAGGELVTGIDDDDEFDKSHVSNLVASFDEVYSFVAASYLEIAENGAVLRRSQSEKVTLESLLHYNRVGNQVITTTARLREIGMFDTDLPAMQDYDTWLRLVIAFGPGLRIPTCSYIRRTDHDHSRISSQVNKLQIAFDLLESKYEKFLKPAHIATQKVQLKKINNEPISFFELLMWANRYNIRFCVSYFTKPVRRKIRKIYEDIAAKLGG